MRTEPTELATLIADTVHGTVARAGTVTEYRQPLVGFANTHNPRFVQLREVVHPSHMLPQNLVPAARSAVSFFLPFAAWVSEANTQDRNQVAREWAVAYVETNQLIGRVCDQLIASLAKRGIQAVAEPATHNFDHVSLVSRWSHKSVAFIAGLGSFGLHQMIITDAGCAGRFGSLILDAELPASEFENRQRCAYYHDQSCLECAMCCPVSAIDPDEPLDKQSCWQRCQQIADEFKDVGLAEVCGKCAIGPCSFISAV
jgi:epoxyqueuosine reductase QueG